MNYKALNTDFTEKRTYFGWVRRIPGVRIMEGRWKRFTRACNWFWFIYKQPCWQEYESLVAIISKRLRDMADEFEKTDITMSSQKDAQDMRKAALLLERWCNEYYSDKAWNEAIVPTNWDFKNDSWNLDTVYKPGYDYSHVQRGHKKDQQALHIACELLKRMPWWWQ